MCRNITVLRGLDPPASDAEIEAAARQFVRKVTGVTATSALTEAAVERAVASITLATRTALSELPPRRRAPRHAPPSRRPASPGE